MDLLYLCVKFDTFFVDLNYMRKIMATNNNNKYSSVKMSGYLEKKSKKMMSSWKSHWFVLEGRLLLYYRSKMEYDALGPCKGSVSLGPSCSVKPLLGTACVFQIETRSNTIALKARTRLEQEKWMQAILAALNQNANATNGMLHFRYSSDDLLPRRTPENKIPLSRQHTLPERLKVEKRYMFRRSFDTLQPNTRPKSAFVSQDTSGKTSLKRPTSITVENVEYCSQDAPAIIIENTEYASCQIVENTEYCPAPTPEEALSDMTQQPSEEYYAISAPTEAEQAYLRKKSLERSEHIYERISGESRISTNSEETLLDNDVYSTAEELKKFYPKSAEDPEQNSVTIDNELYSDTVRDVEDDDVLIDNDQYCTPDIVVRDTELVSYHEYNIPEKEKDRHIYSVPNFDNTDLNDNRISQQSYTDLNPYSVCHIYPKSRQKWKTDRQKDEEYAYYDDPEEYATVSEMQIEPSNMNKLLQKFKRITHTTAGADKEHTKKPNFLKKLFKRERKKSNMEHESVEETEYAQVDEEVVKKMDIAYCIDKKLLAELEMILQAKKRKLEAYLGENNTMSSNSTEGSKTDVATKQQRATDAAVIKPKIPAKPRKDKTPVKLNYENLQTIDEILNNLEQMKRNNTLTGNNVKELINKFDHTVKIRSPTSKQAGESLLDNVKLRSKEGSPTQKSRNNGHFASNDELSRLLNELAKVTNAPILTPGVTSSLGVTSKTLDEEFIDLLPKKGRRHSDPDYDIPRPHTNLGITKSDKNPEEVLTATRFFGPAMPNYENCFISSPPLTSITPDSLEISLRSANITEINMASYTSHKYASKKPSMQKRSLEDEIFVDSLEPGIGR